MVGNRVENLNIHDNKISMMNGAATSAFHLGGVRGLNIENNEIESAKTLVTSKLDGNDIYGAVISGNCTSIDNLERNFVVSAFAKNNAKPIVMMGGEADIEAFCNASSTATYYNITYSATEGGIIKRWAEADGVLYVEPIANEGYVFDGYYVGDVKIEDAQFKFSTTTTVEVRFVAE